MKTRRGNLINLALSGDFDVIIQGCNCFNTMGAGIAKQIKQTFPEAYKVDQKTIRGDRKKLGTYTLAHIVEGPVDIIVVNAYIQYRYGSATPDIDYGAVDSVFAKLRTEFLNRNVSIGYPLIGCGLAKGDWSIVGGIIDTHFKGMDHTLVTQ